MKVLSRADVLRTLHRLQDDGESSASTTFEKSLAARLGFFYKEAVKETKGDNTQKEQTSKQDTKGKSPKQIVVNNRYWIINFREKLPENEKSDEELRPPQFKELETKKTTILSPIPIKSDGEWQNLFDISLKQSQKSKKPDLFKSVKHLSQNKPADKLPKREVCGFNKKVCIIMERTEALRPAWGDMRDLWQQVESLVGRRNLTGYYLASGIEGKLQRLNNHMPKNMNDLENGSLLIYIGEFGALYSGEHSEQWQNHFKRQLKKGYQCQLYSVCPIKHSPVKYVHQLDKRGQTSQALYLLIKALKMVWLIDHKQLRYLREATEGATLQTELLAFNHNKINKDAQYIWHRHDNEKFDNNDNTLVKDIVKRATMEWKNSRSSVACEMEKLLTQLYVGISTPKAEDYQYLQNLAAVSHHLHQSYERKNLSLNLLRSVLPDLELLATLKDWQPVLRVAQEEAIRSGMPLPLKEEGLVSTKIRTACLAQHQNQISVLPVHSINPAQNLLILGNQAYCEETNQVIRNSLPLLNKIHIKDQGYRYQHH